MEELKLPEKFDQFSEGRKAGFMKMKAAKEAGAKVAGYFCTFTPHEVLDAAGLLSVGLCGMSNETVPDAENVLPKNLCPLIKSSYGFALTQKCPYTYWADLIIGETTCDGKKKMYDLLGQLKKTYILQIPQGIDREYSRKMWISEIRRFIDYVSREFDVEITNDMLRSAAEKRNELRHARAELMELMAAKPAPISGLRLYRFLEGLGFSFNLDEAISATRELTASIREAATKSVDAAGNDEDVIKVDSVPIEGCSCTVNVPRIMITGCPIGGVLDKVVGAIERNGGSVVCFENCSGIKAARCYVDTTKEDMAEALADAYMNIGCSVFSPNVKRMENLPRLMEEFSVDGVIDVTLQTCTTYMIETRAVRTLCEEKEMPYMSMETDYSTEDSGQIETRIAAFLENI